MRMPASEQGSSSDDEGIPQHRDNEELQQRRDDEVMALEAILPPSDFLVRKENIEHELSQRLRISLEVPGRLSRPCKVTTRQTVYSAELPQKCSKEEDTTRSQTTSCAGSQSTSLSSISFLPPIKLLIELPGGYPEHQPPRIILLDAPFLVPISNLAHTHSQERVTVVYSYAAVRRSSVSAFLRDYLLQQYNEIKGEVLYTWYETLKETLWTDIVDHRIPSPFSCDDGLVFDEVIVHDGPCLPHNYESQLAHTIKMQDMLGKRKAFEGERFGCGICLEEKRGTKCWKISACDHVFCQECLTAYLSSMIREGYHRQASSCPDPECVKARNTPANEMPSGDSSKLTHDNGDAGMISAQEMTKFVGSELATRLQYLQDCAAASTDPRAGYCPRTACGRLVRGDPKDVGTVYEAMRQCECGYTYCQFCEKAWHGKSVCDLSSSSSLIEAYQEAAPGSDKRKEMEMRYGRANLDRMVRAYEEEQSNKAWLEANCQSCPSCRIRINRSQGCAHMTCKRCQTHFCYHCGTRLDPLQPYRHFNTPGLSCYMKLFEIPDPFTRAQDGEDAIFAAMAW